MTVKKMLLWHPDSPGMRVPVMRGWFGRAFKSAEFATLGEVLAYYRALELVTTRAIRDAKEREHSAGVPVSGDVPPSDAAILAIASSVGMPSSTGADTLVLFARALLAACAPRGMRGRFGDADLAPGRHGGTLAAMPSGVPAGAPGATDAERAAWLADKIGALGDYAKEAAAMLRRWPAADLDPSRGGER